MRTLINCCVLLSAFTACGQANSQETQSKGQQTQTFRRPGKRAVEKAPAALLEEQDAIVAGSSRPARQEDSSSDGRLERVRAATLTRPAANRRSQSISPRDDTAEGKARSKFGPTSDAVKRVVGSLAVVMGAFCLLVWFFKRKGGRANQTLPKHVVEILGQLPMSGRQQMQLVRVGPKLLLLHITPNSAETLTEITDAREVERLCADCRSDQPNSISSSFRQVLEQLGNEPASGFLDPARRTQIEVARGESRRDFSVDA